MLQSQERIIHEDEDEDDSDEIVEDEEDDEIEDEWQDKHTDICEVERRQHLMMMTIR